MNAAIKATIQKCYLLWQRFPVPKIRRGNYIFLGWIGDHSPRHVHGYRDGRLVVKWDLDNWRAMKGNANKRIERLLQELVEEGIL